MSVGSYLDNLLKLVLGVNLNGASVASTLAINVKSPLTATANPATNAVDLGVGTFTNVAIGAVAAPSAPASGVLVYFDTADSRLKSIDANSVVAPLDAGWLTFNNWALVTSTYSAHACELVLCDPTSASPTVTLPDATKCPGKRVRVVDYSGQSNVHNIVIASTGGQQINGVSPSTFNINGARKGLTVTSIGANWTAETVF